MTKEEIIAKKESLSLEIAELEQKVGEIKEDTKPVEPDKALGRLTRLDEMSAKSVREVALRQYQRRLQTAKYELATVGTPLWSG